VSDVKIGLVSEFLISGGGFHNKIRVFGNEGEKDGIN
jgi:hypothetical protein